MRLYNLFQEKWLVLVLLLISLVLLPGCGSLQTQSEKIEINCATLLLDTEITQCYNQATSSLIARRVETATRGLTDGDWPHSFQMIVQLQVEKTGKFQVASVLHSSESRKLDKQILQAVNGCKEVFVPKNELFETAGYSRLKLLIKPARTPLLGNEQLMDNGALVVYVNRRKR